MVFHNYDVAPTGERFLFVKGVVASSNDDERSTGFSSIIMVQNWLEELKRRLPTK